MKQILIPVFAALTLVLSACASPGNNYSSGEVRKLQTSRDAYVVSTKPVLIEKKSSGIGAIVGAITGAAAGSKIGGGDGKKLGAVLGGIGGGVLGNEAEQSQNREAGLEIIVMFEDDQKTAAIVQSATDEFIPGQKVRVVSLNGVTRVTR